MKRSLALAALTLLAGCAAAAGTVTDKVEVASTGEPSREGAVEIDTDIEGRYVLVSVDGAPFANPFENTRPTLLVEGDAIHFASQCLGHSWSWSETGRGISTGRYVPPPAPDGAITGMCARGFTEFEQAVVDGFSGLDMAQVDDDGGLMVTGGGHRLTFQRLSKPDISLIGMWRVIEIDGESLRPDGMLILGGNDTQLVWEPRCAGQRADFTLGLHDGWADWSATRQSTYGQPVCSIGLPAKLADAWEAMLAADRVAWTSDGNLHFTGNGRNLTLQRFDPDGA